MGTRFETDCLNHLASRLHGKGQTLFEFVRILFGGKVVPCHFSILQSEPIRAHRYGLHQREIALRLLLICCFCVTLSGCGASLASLSSKSTGTVSSTDSGSKTLPDSAVPTLSVRESSVQFGSVLLNTIASQSVSFTSSGSAPVTIDSATLSGTGFALSGASFPLTLNEGQTANLVVQFLPVTIGQATGQLTVSSNSSAASKEIISLSGTGTTVPASLNSLSCGDASFTGTGTDTCTVSLTATAPSSGVSVNLSSNNPAVTVPATITVPANASSAEFNATVAAVTTSRTAMLTASHGSASAEFGLKLNAAVPSLTLSAASVAFGNVQVNTSATHSVVLTSSGTGAVVVSSASLAGRGFSLSSAALPVSLNPGQALTLTVQFDPTATGASTGQLTIASNSSTNGTSVVSLSGTGTLPQLSLLSCSSGVITGAGTDTCTVSLTAAAPTGGLAVNLSSSSSNLTVPSTVTIPAGAASVAFTATASSVSASQTVTITGSVGSMFTSYSLQLNAILLALSVDPTSVAFGNIALNTPTTQAITLTSTGTAPVTIEGAALTGDGFTVSGPAFPITLSPNQATKVDISFDPTAAGAATGQLTISSNASANGTAVVGVTGAGVAALAVTPATASTIVGTTQQFTASVAATASSAVTWTVSGTGCTGTACGTISSTGLYTAPATEPASASVTITATSNSDPTQSATASLTIVPPQAAGYNLAWQDTFSTLSLCTTNVQGCNWYNPGLWWLAPVGTITDPNGAGVNLEWQDGQANSTNISTASPNGAYSHSWTYGYFEISMAFDPTTGSSPAIWMLPTSEIGADTSSNGVSYGELDLFEWQSGTPTTFYGTLHVWQDQVDIANNNSSDGWNVPPGTNFANYNTYGVLWTPTSISWYFNNVLMETVNTTSTPYSTVFGGLESYFLILSQQAGCNWATSCPGQASPLNTQVQWVHVYTAPSKSE